MKIINISLERLTEILKYANDNKNSPHYMRTYKINKKDNYYLKVLIKKDDSFIVELNKLKEEK